MTMRRLCSDRPPVESWLFGGQSIPVKQALFETDGMTGIVADLFGEDRYFSDADAFWTAQNAAIEARRDDYLDAGWSDVVIVPAGEHFSSWEYEKAPKRKGGRVYIDVRGNGEVTFHEGYADPERGSPSGKGRAAEHRPQPPRRR
jgi:ParB family chromosome partitioning protein